MKRFTAHRAVAGYYFVYDNFEQREVNRFDKRRDARDVARWENSQLAAKPHLTIHRDGSFNFSDERIDQAIKGKPMSETTGTAYQRLLQLQVELNSWAKPLGDLDMLRHAVAELIDINLQNMHERDEWRGPKPSATEQAHIYRLETKIIGAIKNTIRRSRSNHQRSDRKRHETIQRYQ